MQPCITPTIRTPSFLGSHLQSLCETAIVACQKTRQGRGGCAARRVVTGAGAQHAAAAEPIWWLTAFPPACSTAQPGSLPRNPYSSQHLPAAPRSRLWARSHCAPFHHSCGGAYTHASANSRRGVQAATQALLASPHTGINPSSARCSPPLSSAPPPPPAPQTCGRASHCAPPSPPTALRACVKGGQQGSGLRWQQQPVDALAARTSSRGKASPLPPHQPHSSPPLNSMMTLPRPGGRGAPSPAGCGM